MTMRIYQSTDASAPTLQGVVGGAYSSGWADGSLLNLLDKCLVTGYGSLTQAGWTRSFTGTSKGVFRQGSGCQFYVRVLDDASLTAGAREASLRGSETAADVDLTGATQLFPTAAQVAGGILFRKSNTADTTVRTWLMLADDKTFYLFVDNGSSIVQHLAGVAFGNFHSFKSGDAYNCMIIGRVTSATLDNPANEALDLVNTTVGAAATVGHYMARGYGGLGNSINFGAINSWLSTQVAGAFCGTSTNVAFPNPTDSLLYVSRVYMSDVASTPTNSIRGYLRGLWVPQHGGAAIPLDFSFAGSGGLAGKTLKVLGLRTGNNSAGRYTVETSDTWES